jgi:hypothetical protein
VKWPFETFNQHLIRENQWLRDRCRELQAKLDRLEAAVWAQQSPAGAAFAQTAPNARNPTLERPIPTVSSWEQYEKDWYDKNPVEETANDSSVRTKES